MRRRLFGATRSCKCAGREPYGCGDTNLDEFVTHYQPGLAAKLGGLGSVIVKNHSSES